MWPFISRPKAFAIDFSDAALRVLEVRGTSRPLKINTSLKIGIPEGLIEDGLINDQKALADILVEKLHTAQPRPPSTKKVAAELPESQIFLHHFQLPKELSGEDLETALIQQVNQTMPIELENMAWDFQLLRSSDEGHNVLFAAAPAEIVEAYEHTLALAGLELVSLEPESLALIRSVIDAKTSSPEEMVLLIDMGGRSTSMIFVVNGEIHLSVSRSEGGNLLTERIAQKLDLTKAKAEDLKLSQGLKDNRLHPIVAEVFQPIKDEIAQASSYLQASMGKKPSKVLLAGGTAQLEGIDALLQEILGLPVGLAEPPLTIGGQKSLEWCAVSGVALRASTNLRGINFIEAA
ncbi:MAG: type IV pilus assembly protein PilM [Patescibacteria group bacterium]|nr:type IV pilus assembly protein PilM [Patescibacteria group bacterium]